MVYVYNGIGYTPDSKTYKEINIHGEIYTKIDEFDLVNQIIYEDKPLVSFIWKMLIFLKLSNNGLLNKAIKREVIKLMQLINQYILYLLLVLEMYLTPIN